MSWARSSSDKASPSRPEFARDSASSMAEAPSPSGPSASNGKENQLSRSSSSGLFSKYKGKYKTYLAERRANSKSKASQELDSVAEAAIASNGNPFGNGRPSSKEAAAAAQAADNAALDKDMDAFFEEVSQIKAMLEDLKSRQHKIEAERDRCRTACHMSDVQASREVIQEGIEKATLECKKVKTRLANIEDVNAEIVESIEGTELEDSAKVKMRLTLTVGLNEKFMRQMSAWQAIRVAWQEEDREDTRRQLQVVTGQEFDDEEVDDLLFSGQSDQIYQKAVEGGLRGQSVKEMLGQIEQRNDQMRKLEASMLDLQQIFMDMSVLVEEQAHQLDNIEQWVMNTQHSVRKGIESLLIAKEIRKKSAQKKALTFVTGAGITAAGAGIAATGAGAPIGVPIALAGAGVMGVSGLMN
ncbi:hypothetical protein WJX74_007719 [Apatococcus lobatus]|uniref:t-SNARE coiled-coil homology domain-containing protein n=1 Tax=Apatococcus lobatus TaxID=904363 RepID=A0AAW1QMW5_9CHLO